MLRDYEKLMGPKQERQAFLDPYKHYAPFQVSPGCDLRVPRGFNARFGLEIVFHLSCEVLCWSCNVQVEPHVCYAAALKSQPVIISA